MGEAPADTTATIHLTEREMQLIYSSLRTCFEWCYVNRSEEVKKQIGAETDALCKKLLIAKEQLKA